MCRILIAVEFDESARSLLARATHLALSQQATRVDIGHILASSSEAARRGGQLLADANWLELQAREAPQPVKVQDIPFCPSAREALASSAQLCNDSSIGEVEVLVACLSFRRPSTPLPSLATLLEDAHLRQLLAWRGVDLDRLELALAPYALPRPGRGPHFGLGILAELLTEGAPPGYAMGRCGLTLSLLLELMSMSGPEPAPHSEVTGVDFSQALGPGWERFSRSAQEALRMAWFAAGQAETEMNLDQLYRGTFVSPSVRGLTMLPGVVIKGEQSSFPRAPQLSADVYRVIAHALKLAGSGRVEVRHLLVALADLEFPLLKEAGITPAFLREQLEL